jgi:hypothetical protein
MGRRLKWSKPEDLPLSVKINDAFGNKSDGEIPEVLFPHKFKGNEKV